MLVAILLVSTVAAHTLVVFTLDTSTDFSDNQTSLGANSTITNGTVQIADGESYTTSNLTTSEPVETVEVNISGIDDSANIVVYDGVYGTKITNKSVSTTGTFTLDVSASSDSSIAIAIDDGGNTAVNGTTDIESIKLVQSNSAPFAAGADTQVAVNDTVELNASDSTDPDGDALSYEWDFDDDGTYDATGEVTSTSFASSGTYNVTLRVTDSHGATDTANITITVDPDSDGDGVIDSEDAYPLNAPGSKIVDNSDTKIADDAFVELASGSGSVDLTVYGTNNTTDGNWTQIGTTSKSASSSSAVLATVNVDDTYDHYKLVYEGDATVQDAGLMYDSAGSGGDVNDTVVGSLSLVDVIIGIAGLLGLLVVLDIFEVITLFDD
ncbi:MULTISPECIES: PKD domain-containing protein [Halorussus]|uniref:PKD domain-containing protein n=1 Tax=Halorussus TaxID=1070314 RepID=UPI00209F43A8|nr:PKD domain-containing protein [Halorussus vallis]USZ77698.1 PKD domain-containing protein [Halorussus vallis]